MSKCPVSVAEFVLPASVGTRVFQEFFPGKTLKVDDVFRDFVSDGDDPVYFTTEVGCVVYQTQPGRNADNAIVEWLGWGRTSSGVFYDRLWADPARICALLKYLGGDGGGLLDLADGENETNMILGYAKIKGRKFVFFVEHELEDDIEEIHLHARAVNLWGSDIPKVIVPLLL